MSDLSAPSPRFRLSLLILLALAGGASVFAIVALSRKAGAQRANVLLVHCAASLKAPLEAIAVDYRRDTGVRIELSLGGSQTLLANIEIARQGDLYLPADESYIALARQRKLVKEVYPVAEQTAVIAVPKGNPRRVRSLASFQNSALTLAQANPDHFGICLTTLDGQTHAVGDCDSAFTIQ